MGEKKGIGGSVKVAAVVGGSRWWQWCLGTEPAAGSGELKPPGKF